MAIFSVFLILEYNLCNVKSILYLVIFDEKSIFGFVCQCVVQSFCSDLALFLEGYLFWSLRYGGLKILFENSKKLIFF